MARSRQSNETAKALVSPLFALSNALLKSGEMMLNSAEAAAKNARNVRVAVLPDGNTPTRKRSASASKRSAPASKRSAPARKKTRATSARRAKGRRR